MDTSENDAVLISVSEPLNHIHQDTKSSRLIAVCKRSIILNKLGKGLLCSCISSVIREMKLVVVLEWSTLALWDVWNFYLDVAWHLPPLFQIAIYRLQSTWGRNCPISYITSIFGIWKKVSMLNIFSNPITVNFEVDLFHACNLLVDKFWKDQQ